jgi:TRAP-type uncharacterized transport system fused permease subunit
MWLTWKYTLPAFLVPFIFVLSDNGVGLLFEGGAGTVALAFTCAVLAVGALAVVTGKWLIGPAGWPERVLFLVAAISLLVMEPLWIGVGLAFGAAGTVVHLIMRKRAGDDVSGKLKEMVPGTPEHASTHEGTTDGATAAPASTTGGDTSSEKR